MYKNILVPVDTSHAEVGAKIVQIAKKLVDPDGHITALTVFEPLPGYVASYIDDDIIARNHGVAVEKLEQLLSDAGVAGTAMIREGNPVTKILEVADAIGTEAIIVGSHQPDYRDYLIGSTAARVVRHAQCTVIVSRNPQKPAT